MKTPTAIHIKAIKNNKVRWYIVNHISTELTCKWLLSSQASGKFTEKPAWHIPLGPEARVPKEERGEKAKIYAFVKNLVIRDVALRSKTLEFDKSKAIYQIIHSYNQKPGLLGFHIDTTTSWFIQLHTLMSSWLTTCTWYYFTVSFAVILTFWISTNGKPMSHKNDHLSTNFQPALCNNNLLFLDVQSFVSLKQPQLLN